MNADIRWIDNPEIFRVNQIAAHSDHDYFTNYEALNSNSHNLIQSLNGQWKFCFSRNAMSRPADFYKEDYDTSYFDKIMVPGHIELAGYDQIRYINTLYPWEGKTYRRGAYSIESAGDGTGMFSELSIIRLVLILKNLTWIRSFVVRELDCSLKVWSRRCMYG